MAKKQDDGWGFDPEPTTKFDWKAYQKGLKRYNTPITKHECCRACKGQYALKNWHEREDVFDDFELSQRERESAHMFVLSAKGHELKQRLMLRRFVSTRDGSFVLRFETPEPNLFKKIVADIVFESEEDQTEYFDYALSVFEFNEVSPLGDTDDTGWDDPDDGWGFETSDEEAWDNW